MRFRLIAAVLGVLLLLGGCGSGGGTESDASSSSATSSSPKRVRELSITVDGWHGPQNSGILMADARGYFADAGLKVSTYTPALPARPIPYVVEREVDLAVAQLPQVVLAKEKGAPIVALGSLIAQPTAAMIWLKESHLHDIADLEGKTIGFPGVPFQRAFLERVLAHAGLTPSQVRIKAVGYDLIPALVHGEVDAVFGGSANIQGVKLEARGLNPVITLVGDLGIPAYDELVVVARRDSVTRDPGPYRRFMAATSKGTAAAIEKPGMVPEVIAHSAESEPFTGPRMMMAQVEATLPLLSEDGYMDPGQASELMAWMKEQGLIEKTLPPQALLTNAFVKR